MKFIVYTLLVLGVLINSAYAVESVVESGEVISDETPSTEMSSTKVSSTNVSPTASPVEPIPYKKNKELTEQATPVLLVVTLFLIGAFVFYYFFRSKLSVVNPAGDKNIHVIEIKRLNTRLTVFHMRVKSNEFLLVQSGDNIQTLDLDGKAVELEESFK